jgi:L-fuconolactonase
MPYGGNDWLALTQEPTLEPEIPICDPHHHFWDLRPERIPYQCYLLHELIADINCGHNVRATVFIETRGMYRPDGPVEMRPVGEVEFVQGLAGHANLNLGDRVEPVLAALQAASPNRFRGIRHTVTWDPHPEVENGAARVLPRAHRTPGVGGRNGPAGSRRVAASQTATRQNCVRPRLDHRSPGHL